MYLGKIMELGPAESVIRGPRNPYTQALVSVSPSTDPPETDADATRVILVGETPDAAHVPPGCRFNPRCPVAFDRCRVDEPPLFDVGDGHQAACWFAEPGAPPMPVPRIAGRGSDARRRRAHALTSLPPGRSEDARRANGTVSSGGAGRTGGPGMLELDGDDRSGVPRLAARGDGGALARSVVAGHRCRRAR